MGVRSRACAGRGDCAVHRAMRLAAAAAAVLLCWTTSGATAQQNNNNGYFGVPLGELTRFHHGVRGNVFAVDARTIHIRDLHYDGEGPAAYFYAGNSKAPGAQGFRIRDERGSATPLKRYRGKHVTITLPEGKTLHQLKWFAIWCEEFSVNFGDVRIPKNLELPKPHKIGSLSGIHGVSSDPVVVVDAQTLLVPSFSYDGEAPDAKFWVGRGPKPSPQGIRVPDENGKEVPLRRYEQKTLVLTLPGDLTVFDIGHFGVWCEAFAVDFGHVVIPRTLSVPPSLRMLGVQPQSKLNCEVLHDDLAFEVRWAVAGDSVVLQLVAKLENNEYMAFGLSGDSKKSVMVGGDVVVAWVDKNTLKGTAVDYILDAKSQCSGTRGSCPDTRVKDNSNSVRLLNAALVNGYSIVTYQRPLAARDSLDKPVLTNGSQPVIWAVGPLNQRQEVSYHSLANRDDIFLEFGRAPRWNCPLPDGGHGGQEDQDREPARPASQQSTAVTTRPPATPAPHPTKGAWEIPPIQCHEPEDGVFYAQMGPTGGKHGYPAITGHVGWGISWYINGLLIPEINVVRGKTYTFVVEGGLDPETPARYHPFYITDDSVGGFEHKTAEERANVRIFAGAVQDKRGNIVPTGTGRLCNWTPDPNQPLADEFTSFGAYQRTLTLVCDEGEPGVVQWTPDHNTPDTVYYQCFTHRYLGWKINVLDSCDRGSQGAASEPVPSQVAAPVHQDDKDDDKQQADADQDGDLDGKASIQVETRVPSNAAGSAVPAKDLFQDIKGLQGLISDADQALLIKGIEKFAAAHDKEPFPFDTPLAQVQIQTQSDVQAQAEAQSQSPAGVQAQAAQAAQAQAAQADPTTLYDHLKEETAKQDKQASSPAGPAAAASVSSAKISAQLPQLPQLQQQQQLAAAVGLLSGPGPAYLSHGLLGPGLSPSMMHQLKYIPHPPLRMPGLASMALGPLTRPLAGHGPLGYAKHKLPHGMMPLNMHSHRHGLPSGMIRRPVMGPGMSPMLLQQQATRQGMIMASPSQHNYVVKKKPHFRVPSSAGIPAGMLTSTTLRPLYLQGLQGMPATTGLYSSTLRPTLAQSIMAAQVQAQAQAEAQAQAVAASQQQQIYAIKLQKLAAALSTSTTTTSTTSTTTPAPVSIPAHFSRPNHLSPLHANHYTNHHANHRPTHQANHHTNHHSVQSFPAYYRPSSNGHPPVSPAFDPESSLEHTPSLGLGGNLAVNTGFNPSSVVVEGGFKPILQRRQDEAEDRMAFVEGGDDGDDLMEGSVVEMERRSSDVAIEDEDYVDDDGVQEEQQLQQPKQQERRTESFEPMFIPSPPDRNSFKPGAKKASEPGKSLGKPKQGGKQARRDKPVRLTPLIVRPRPAILGRPLYPNLVVPPFKIQAQARRGHRENIEDDDDDEEDEVENLPVPEHLHQDAAATTAATPATKQDDKPQERSQDDEDEEEDDDMQDETMMAAERMDTYYLPPSAPAQPQQSYSGHHQQGLPSLPHTIVTYDGKAVDPAVAASIPNPPPESQSHSPSSADLVRGTPQFGPFLGEAPPPIPAAPSPLDLPQLQPQQVQQTPLAQYPPLLTLSAPGGEDSLALVHGHALVEDPLQTDATHHHGHQGHQGADEHAHAHAGRQRRSPHHEPGHEGHDEHDGVGAAPGRAPSSARAGLVLTLLCAMLVSALSADRRVPC
ncbi:Skeletor [Frankliniella occidentalis]|uniref:Protein Skeletor, isoforms D/E-like isoform X1 n=1 Tax=Frankliniella occidentalis TaxID=133901 RepID=A0A9C6X3A4_FRAOC|nr:protein Skeletor, isoforms D/E-like isoform X1 [Frankliniella occidentalis]KAE8752192.1 Skeletor [Frankliniella occidentalis]